MSTRIKLKKGDIINYRMVFVRITKVEEDGVWVKGPYGETQKLDWEDVK